MTVAEFAKLLRVTQKTVLTWIKAGMPVASHGSRGGGKVRNKTQINLQPAIEWYFAENYERLELDRQKTRLTSEQADKTAFENAERSRDLVELSLVTREFGALLGEIRTNAPCSISSIGPQVGAPKQLTRGRSATLRRRASCHELR
jgi:phage terminase Nu1 subunit (DNA packaging protein)